MVHKCGSFFMSGQTHKLPLTRHRSQREAIKGIKKPKRIKNWARQKNKVKLLNVVVRFIFQIERKFVKSTKYLQGS